MERLIMTHWISFLVFIQSVRLLLSRQISSHYISDQAFNNRLSPVDFLSEQHHSTSIQCALACEKADDCKSYFYNINSSDCKLVSSILNNLNNTTSSIGMKYYIDKSEIRCSGQHSIYGTNITVVDVDPVPGLKISFKCSPGYYSDGHGGFITCLDNGTWSEPLDPCKRCSNYSDTYVMRPGKNFYPPQDVIGGWYPTILGELTANKCTESCTNRELFTCRVTYFYNHGGDQSSCLDMPIRIEDNFQEYRKYYHDNSSYQEYVRLCV